MEQLEFKLEKIIGIEKHAGKVRKTFIFQMFQVSTQVFCDLKEFGIRKNPGNTTQEMHICVYGLQITIWCQRD